MQEVDWTDADGRRWRVRVPAGCPADMYPAGIPVGPPALSALREAHGWSIEFEVRLHNELHSRGLYTPRDVLARPRDVTAALQAAYRCDMQAIQRHFFNEGG